MMGIGSTELIVILIITFLIFGGKRLPEIGAGLGKAIRSFNKGVKGESDDKKDDSSKKTPDKLD
jgi:sec-independent protein translocase protein TatA